MKGRRSKYSENEEKITTGDIRSFYSNAAVSQQTGLCCPNEYKKELLSHIPQEVLEISYGCGSPIDQANIKKGETVADLGSGGGIDCFIAAKMVGENGMIYGIDMTQEMLTVAQKNAYKVGKNLGYHNVEFKQGFLETIPIEDSSIDIVTSNCVINLSTNKAKVFKEIWRILKPRGRFVIADIISEKPLPKNMRNNKKLWGECISGAFTLKGFLKTANKCNFIGLTVRKDYLWKTVNGINFYSFILEGCKLDFPKASSSKTLTLVYTGPFTSITYEGSEYPVGVPIKVDENKAKFLNSGPFLNHFNIMDSNESTSEKSKPSCCG